MNTDDGESTSNLSLPSWAPDWSQEWSEQELLWAPWPNKAPDSTFCASRQSPAVVNFWEDGNSIHTKRVIVDQIGEIWDDLPFLKYKDVPRPQEIAHIRKAKQWRAQTPNEGVYASPAARADAHWRTLVGNSGLDHKEGVGADWSDVYEAWMEETVAGNRTFFLNKVNRVGIQRRVMLSEKKGYTIMGPDTAKVEDIICVILGCDMPVILRRRGSAFEFIGICYVHGIMHGEAIEQLERGELKLTHFELS